MKIKLLCVALLSGLLIFTGCSSFKKTSKRKLTKVETSTPTPSTTTSAIVDTAILVDKDGRSSVIGTAVDTPIEAGASLIIDRQMDKLAGQIAGVNGAKVESFTDNNMLRALRITFESKMLFEYNKNTLNQKAQQSLAEFAKLLINNPGVDILIFGHTDNVGTLQANQKTSEERAQVVARFLRVNRVPINRIKGVAGRNFSNPVASNITEVGRTLNNRIEIYIYAGENMIKQANQDLN